MRFKTSTEDVRLKFEQQTEQHSRLASEFEKAKLKENADYEETLLKVDEASKKASNDVSCASGQLEKLVKRTETEIFERIGSLKESLDKIDVTVECLKAGQKKCAGLVAAHRGLLNELSDDVGSQLREVKERELNNGRDRQNIKEQIVEMQTRSDQEANRTKQNIQVKSFYASYILRYLNVNRFENIEKIFNMVSFKSQNEVRCF